ncbi:MAG: CoA transferase subunit A [Candidatus Koribacter versatilis]|uniref:CoA transferase subunit A n=1 Tax=Candidatus Korobacter versatilis TaxID=658062 RepID=A0A932EQG4_9BACT|nr:CoA transferase subunit A [Candidatus Koribacter versatilis]
MTKLQTMREAVAELVPDGASVALGCQMEQMIPFGAGHEMMRQRRCGLTLIGPISDVLFDQMIGAGCAERVIAAWVGNVMMGSAYNFRRAAESGELEVVNMTNFSVALGLQAAAMGVPFLPTRTALGSDVAKSNPFFAEIADPFASTEYRVPSTEKRGRDARATAGETPALHAVRAIVPDVVVVHVQRADEQGNAHCWGNFGVMIEAVRAAKRVIVTCEEIVPAEVIASDPNRTVIPGFLVSAVVEAKYGAHPSPVQGYYARDDAYFRQYHEQTKTPEDFARWAERWVYGVKDRRAYANLLGACRLEELAVKRHAYAAKADFGY